MNQSPREQFRYRVQWQHKLPPERPTTHELDNIVADADSATQRLQRPLTDSEWAQTVANRVDYRGEYVRKGMDFSDLNALLALVAQRTDALKK